MKRQVFPWREGNQFELLIDGPVFFPAMLKAIAQAQQQIDFELYLLEQGACAERVIADLLAAAARGVRVRCLFDQFGSRGLGVEQLQRLAQAVELRLYNPMTWRRGLNNLYRDHRKLLLIDQRVGFVGGTGVTDEFWQPQTDSSAWHELMVRMQGPVVLDWQALFDRQWQACTQSAPWKPVGALARTTRRHLAPWPQGNQGYGRVAYASANQHRDIVRTLKWALHNGQQRIWFATPYFLPTWAVRRELRRAAKRGVDVRVLSVSGNTDNAPVRYAAQRHYSSLLRAGVRVYEYQPRFLHFKAVLVDDWVSLGSCNFDHWNLRFNLDANLEACDQSLTEAVAHCLDRAFAESKELTRSLWQQRSVWVRCKQRFWGWCSGVMLRLFNDH